MKTEPQETDTKRRTLTASALRHQSGMTVQTNLKAGGITCSVKDIMQSIDSGVYPNWNQLCRVVLPLSTAGRTR